MKIKSRHIISVLCVALSYSFSVLFLYFNNISDTYFSEAFLPLIAFIFAGLLIFAITWPIFKNSTKSALFSFLTGILLCNFTFLARVIRKVIPWAKYRHSVATIIFIIFTLFLLIYNAKNVSYEKLLSIVCIAFGALVMFNFVTAFPIIIEKMSVAKQTTVLTKNSEKPQTNPNFYYLLCDEYGGFEQLEKSFAFDNAQLKQFLQERKFNISQTSQTNIFTTIPVVSNYMALDYVVNDRSSVAKCQQFIDNSEWFRLFTDEGYTITGVGNTAWLGLDSENSEEAGVKSSQGHTFLQMVMEPTILYPLFPKDEITEASQIVKSFDDLESLKLKPNSSQFTFFYVNSPHQPFLFDEDGKLNSKDKFLNYDNNANRYYIGQIKYLNKRLTTAITNIIANDPDSVIVLCSDHGMRFGTANFPEGYKYIMNNVYYKGEELAEIEGMSGLNTLRCLINKLFDYDLPFVEVKPNV